MLLLFLFVCAEMSERLSVWNVARDMMGAWADGVISHGEM